MERLITTKFDIGSIVYLITDKEQLPRMVTGIVIKETAELGMIEKSEVEAAAKELNIS